MDGKTDGWKDERTDGHGQNYTYLFLFLHNVPCSKTEIVTSDQMIKEEERSMCAALSKNCNHVTFITV